MRAAVLALFSVPLFLGCFSEKKEDAAKKSSKSAPSITPDLA
jgi:hypothetical protein